MKENKIAYAREDDGKLVKFCLYMLEVMSEPRFSLVGILWRTFAVFAATIGIAMWLDSPVPFFIVLCAAFLAAVPAAIGAAIRDRRLRNE